MTTHAVHTLLQVSLRVWTADLPVEQPGYTHAQSLASQPSCVAHPMWADTTRSLPAAGKDAAPDPTKHSKLTPELHAGQINCQVGHAKNVH